MTRAPASASRRLAMGAATACSSDTTRSPSSGLTTRRSSELCTADRGRSADQLRMDYDHLQERVQARGLTVRGGFHPDASDGVPPLPDGRPAKTLVMLGGVGTSFWQAFQASPEAAQQNDPLDAWTRRVTDELASDLGAVALYPFGGPPYLPFQRWAKRAEPAFQSPLGLLIHPDYGLWHS